MYLPKPSIFCTTGLESYVVETKAGKEYHIKGYISTHDEDLVGDIVTDSGMQMMLDDLTTRNIKIDLEHETMPSASQEPDSLKREIAKTKLAIGRFVQAARDAKGIFADAVLNKDHPRFQETWNSIQNKFIDSFSIAYLPIKATYQVKNGVRKRMLEIVRLLNVALTGNPINPAASITTAFTKSLQDLENMQSDSGEFYEIKNIALFIEETNNRLEKLENFQLKNQVSKMPENQTQDNKQNEAEKKAQESAVEIKSSIEKLGVEIKSLSERLEKIEKKSDDEKDDEKEKEEETEKKSMDEIKEEVKSMKERLDKFLGESQPKGVSAEQKSAAAVKSAEPVGVLSFV